MIERRVGKVCLTADVHNRSRRSWEQRWLGQDEVDILAEYLRIAADHGVPVTVFVSGRAARDNPERLRGLMAAHDTEIGGHWYDAFPWPLPYGIWGRAFGLRRGPEWWQRREIRRAIDAITDVTGARIRSWRDHAYRHDRNTADLLAAEGVRVMSDEVDARQMGPHVEGKMLVVPINVLPDHENIRHLPPRRGRVFPGTLTADEWVDRVEQQVAAIVARGGVATVLAHPTCMKLSDDFAAFRRLCRALAQNRCVRLSDLTGD